MKLSRSVRRQFELYGKAGGETRARRMEAAARTSIARRAAIARWTRKRFGNSSFAELALPGGEIVDAGLADLLSGKETPASLLVSLAAPRLRREGVPVPKSVHLDPEERLYRLLAQTEGRLAHFRYRAFLRLAASFADACRGARGHRWRRRAT